MKKIYLPLVFLIIILFVNSNQYLHAVDNGNGVDRTTFSNNHSFGTRGIWFTSFDPSSTDYVYNETMGTSTTSGLLDVNNLTGKKTLYVSVPVLNSTSVTVRAEGQFKDSGLWGEITTVTYAAATLIAEIWSLPPYVGDIRVGVVVVDDVAGDEVNVSGEFTSELK